MIPREFGDALVQLTVAHAPYAGVGAVVAALTDGAAGDAIRMTSPPAGPQMSEVEAELRDLALGASAAPVPPVDPDFLDEAGRMRPMSEIADIIRAKTGVVPLADEGA